MDIPTEELPLEQPPKRSYKRLWCAILSAAVPGSGDWLLGNKKQGALFLIIMVALLLCYWPLRLPSMFSSMICLIYAGVTLNIASGCLTLLRRSEIRDGVSNWWVLLVVPIAVLSGSAESRIVVVTSGFRIFTTAGHSMSPIADVGETVMTDMLYFRHRTPRPDDVIVFKHRGIVLIKRVIAIGGSTITCKDGQLTLDGLPLDEPYVIHNDRQSAKDERGNFGPVRVPEGQLFVMGDNRDESLDSRVQKGEFDFGPVFVSDVIGKPLYVLSSKGSPTRDGLRIQ